jgi:N-acyl-D-aspartate/D-glutamate deacylase
MVASRRAPRPPRPLFALREKQIITLEEAVRKLTFMLASIFGLPDRGLLAR